MTHIRIHIHIHITYYKPKSSSRSIGSTGNCFDWCSDCEPCATARINKSTNKRIIINNETKLKKKKEEWNETSENLQAWRNWYFEMGGEEGLLGFLNFSIIFSEAFSMFSSSSSKLKTSNLLIEEEDEENVRWVM